MGRLATGIDVGSQTAVCLRGRVKGTTFVATHYAVGERSPGVSGWDVLEPGFKLGRCRVGISGRDVNVRYTRVPRVPDWQLRKLMRFEVEEVGGQSETRVVSDFNVLPEMPEIEGEDVVLLALARESHLEEELEGLASVGGVLDAFTPSAIALYNAWLRYGVLMDDTVLVANVGRENTDVILARGTDLLFARNLSGGSLLFDQALEQAFGASAEQAERLKLQQGTLAPRGPGAGDRGGGETGAGGGAAAEKVSQALLAPAGQLLSLLQSTVAFCKSQVKLSGLKLDRVLLCGGGAALPGLDRYLASGMGVPVELFDPFAVVDVSALSEDERTALEEHALESVVALGLATGASDPEAYAIEIVPERVAKRRELLGAKAFLWAAGLVAAGYVGYDAWRTASELERVEASARVLKGRLDSVRRAHASAQELLAENAELAGLAAELFAAAGSGEQAARALEAIHAALPETLWLTSLSSAWGSDPELGVERDAELPILHVEGRAAESTESVPELFAEFVRGVRARLPEARLKERLGASNRAFTLDLCLLAPAPPGEEPRAAAPGAELPDEGSRDVGSREQDPTQQGERS